MQLAINMTSKIKAKEKQKEAPEIADAQQRSTAIVTRGRIFEGFVTKKFPTRVVVEFERTVYVPKYQRFYKKKTRLHARLLETVDVNVGDYIKVRECHPLSKIIHFIVIEKLRAADSTLKVKAQASTKVKA